MMWLHDNAQWLIQLGFALLFGLIAFQVIAQWDHLITVLRRFSVVAFFRYHSGHGRHALANMGRQFSVGLA